MSQELPPGLVTSFGETDVASTWVNADGSPNKLPEPMQKAQAQGTDTAAAAMLEGHTGPLGKSFKTESAAQPQVSPQLQAMRELSIQANQLGDVPIGTVLYKAEEEEEEVVEDEDPNAEEVEPDEDEEVEKSDLMSSLDDLGSFAKGGPYMGPRGGKWADAAHKIPWTSGAKSKGSKAKGGKSVDAHVEDAYSAKESARSTDSFSEKIEHLTTAGKSYQAAHDASSDAKEKKRHAGNVAMVNKEVDTLRPQVGGAGDKKADDGWDLDAFLNEEVEPESPAPVKAPTESDLDRDIRLYKEQMEAVKNDPDVEDVPHSWSQEPEDVAKQLKSRVKADGVVSVDRRYVGSGLAKKVAEELVADGTLSLRNTEGENVTHYELKKSYPETSGQNEDNMGHTSDGDMSAFSGLQELDAMIKAGPFIGPKGGKWADAKHTIAWKEDASGGSSGKAAYREAKELLRSKPKDGQRHKDGVSESTLKKVEALADKVGAAGAKKELLAAVAAIRSKQGGSDSSGSDIADAKGVIDPAKAKAKNEKHAAQEAAATKDLDGMKEGTSVTLTYPGWRYPLTFTKQGGKWQGDGSGGQLNAAGLGKMTAIIKRNAAAGKTGFKVATEGGGDKTEKSMSAAAILEDYLTKSHAGLPSGNHTQLKKEKSNEQGASADGGSLEGTPKSGGAGSSGGEGYNVDGMPSAPSAKSEQLSEDDDAIEKQLTNTGPKALETTRKSFTPAAQREMVAHEHAQKVSQLRKGEADVNLNRTSDDMAADLVKSDTFYHGASPSFGTPQIDLTSHQNCYSCKGTFAKSLTACPDCGTGQVVHQVLPVEVESGRRQAMLRKSSALQTSDVFLGAPKPLSVVSSGQQWVDFNQE